MGTYSRRNNRFEGCLPAGHLTRPDCAPEYFSHTAPDFNVPIPAQTWKSTKDYGKCQAFLIA